MFRLFFRWPHSLATALEFTRRKIPSSRSIHVMYRGHVSLFSRSSFRNSHKCRDLVSANIWTRYTFVFSISLGGIPSSTPHHTENRVNTTGPTVFNYWDQQFLFTFFFFFFLLRMKLTALGTISRGKFRSLNGCLYSGPQIRCFK